MGFNTGVKYINNLQVKMQFQEGKCPLERNDAHPTTEHTVGKGADQQVVDRVPEDADQGGDGIQARFQSDHIGEKDDIENSPQGALAGVAPVAGPVCQFVPERQEACTG